MPLEMLGKYERLDVLGHGASGIVYLAKDTLLGKQVALKEITAQGEERQRFLEEARVLDRLRHPNIVQVNSVDEIGGKIIIDMEYVRGRTLQEILRDTPKLPLGDAIHIAAQVCDGLAFAHARRTVHRDIKPANILITDDGLVKLVDFGLAAQLGTHSFAGGAGTYAYMAPEDFHPEEQSDRQSDIWAVGVILYEMLAGSRPFRVTKTKDPFAWKRAIEDDPIIPVSELRPDVPPALEAVVTRALARDKHARYLDAAVMARKLREPNPQRPNPAIGMAVPSPEGQGMTTLVEYNLAPAPLGKGVGLGSSIDDFLTAAPDHWPEACAALTSGALMAWLHGLGEEPLAQVAEEVVTDTDRDEDDQLRDFLYRAGLDTDQLARRDFLEGTRLAKYGQFAEAVPLLRRAVRLDPRPAVYHQELADAFRACDEGEEAAASQISFSTERVDFGTLRRGQTRSAKIILRYEGSGALEGRVAVAPGWVRVDPPAFTTRKRQPLTITAVTEGIWATPIALSETIVLETSRGRQEIAVRASILPARLGWSQIAFWYVPLLICCILPALVGLVAQKPHGNIGQPGEVASGLLFISVVVMAFAADLSWPTRLLPLGLLGLIFWDISRALPRLSHHGVPGLALAQTAVPLLMLLVLQSCALIFDPRGLGGWKLWRWITAAAGLFISYLLLHLG